MSKELYKAALKYHQLPKPGKLSVQASKPCNTKYELSLAYSPGVAAPCQEIYKNPQEVFNYTNKGNLVAVVTNGTAVLGLGNIGPAASKPVMEGKAVLFKHFAGIDVFDLEVQSNSVDDFVNTVKSLEPSFGGINLEDLKAPECFEIEEKLKEQMNIPVFHDDQHGTAIISTAALINACEIQKKSLSKIKVVFNGAGAAALSCAMLFTKVGVKKENIIFCDSTGVIYKGRKENMNTYKERWACSAKARNLKEALKGADVFCGLSVAGAIGAEEIKSMAKKPIVFALANPDPEILPDLAKKACPDIIVATGRSDFPNQVNNVLGFPFIFRGALDTHSTHINTEMKLAAVYALSNLAKQNVPDSVSLAYNNAKFLFGPEYIIPTPFDERVLTSVTPAVAKAAMDSGVARKNIADFEQYTESLTKLQGLKQGFIRTAINRIKNHNIIHKEKPIKIIFAEGECKRILKALNTLALDKICEPTLIGNFDKIQALIKEESLQNLDGVSIISPKDSPNFENYIKKLYETRQRKGISHAEATRLMTNPYYFSAMALHSGDFDTLISGAKQNYADCLKPILQIIGSREKQTVAGLNILLLDDKMFFLTDTTVNIEPSSEQLAQIAIQTSIVAKYYGLTPRIAMLSYSNFSGNTPLAKKMKEATQLVKQNKPNLIIDGEMQGDTAVNTDILNNIFSFSDLKEPANILLFPNLAASNISYKLLKNLGGLEVLGPFLTGIKKPANILQRGASVDDIIGSITLSVKAARIYQNPKKHKLTYNSGH
ncbi:MAG: NADP-dependent malic enzyme [Bdellovibrionaceae bacterium]|nr:NADP-dependent malic enzyme [Pseudobdellovibrionaceae bacterium]